MWNVWLGGTDNFPVDRELAGRIQAAMPSMPLIARFARLFLADAVGRLSEFGIRQFLDIGSGVPTADNTIRSPSVWRPSLASSTPTVTRRRPARPVSADQHARGPDRLPAR